MDRQTLGTSVKDPRSPSPKTDSALMTNPDATTRDYWSIVSPCTIRDVTRNVSQTWPRASDVPLLILAKKKTWNATHHRPLAERGPITCLFQRVPPLYGNRSVDHLPWVLREGRGSPALATPGGELPILVWLWRSLGKHREDELVLLEESPSWH